MARREGVGRAAERIAVWWIGEGAFEPGVLDVVRERVATEFACSVSLVNPRSRPLGTFDPGRRQHSSRAVLTWLLAQVPAGERVLGITDVDLFIPILTFVFGEAQLEGRAAVVSTARLVDQADERRTVWRLATESVHELGHTFGLLHCGEVDSTGRRAAPCVMSRSASVRSVDEKSPRLCATCRARYLTFQQDGAHVYREHPDTHR